MKIRLLNDLHLEEIFHEKDKFKWLDLPGDPDTIVVLAGDIHNNITGALELINTLKDKVKAVVYVLGNHEFWGNCINEVRETAREKIIGDNVYLLDNDLAIIDDVVFIGGTLWTDFGNNNPIIKVDAQLQIGDYKHILVKDGGIHRILLPDDVLKMHYETKNFIFDTVEGFADQKLVVVTHHAPTQQSIGELFKNHTLNDLYVNDLEGLLHTHNIDLWLHGHVHDLSDYTAGNTRVVCNPRGYPGMFCKTFDPTLVIDI